MNDRTPTEATAGNCTRCGFPWKEHTYNGACYGICGQFVAASPPAPAAEPVAWAVYWQGGLWALCETKREAVCEAGDLEPKGEARPLYTHPIDAAAIRAEARKAEGWRSLDDCPSDGSPIWLASFEEGQWWVTEREADGEWWRTISTRRMWMPRQPKPAPPAGGCDGE